jgi:HEPN domain-containing protein
VEGSKDWPDEARGDLEHAKNDFQDGFFNWACFSSQRKKKAAFYLRVLEMPKIA